MAVKLILVVLVLAVVSSTLAQQSEQSGGQKSDRRLALRRFRNRNRDNDKSDEVKENRRQNPRKLANQEEILNRRKQLLQRNNITRRRNFSRKPTVNEVEEETVTKQTVRIKSPSVEDDVVVEKISNSNRDIISTVLNKEEEETKVPFSGKSEVRTVSNPSGFRSLNEQITRISFKKTTSKPDAEEEVDDGSRVLGRSRLAPGRRVISRPRLTDRTETTTSRVLLLSQASPALKALLATANDPEESEETKKTEESVESSESLTDDARAAIR